MTRPITLFVLLIALLSSCGDTDSKTTTSKKASATGPALAEDSSSILPSDALTTYARVTLTTDMDLLTDNEKEVLKLLIEAAGYMDDIFWKQAYGNKGELLSKDLPQDILRHALVNYGPWDRLKGDQPFISGVGEKPKGAGFYPIDMTEEEFEAFSDESKTSLYTKIERNVNGELTAIPYSQAYRAEMTAAADLLKGAADLTEDKELERYLDLRAEALLNDEYDASDIAWLEMKDNHLDIIIGPIENYEDKRYGYKAANEAYVLVKDMEWSKRLERYVAFLPELQAGLPVEEKYKQESPGTDSQLNAYDAVYYAGDCNAGSKTIAVNLPNDEAIQTSKGTRRSQLKNAMRAKYDAILLPIADELIAADQREHITFEAFFGNTMFHEVAHGLGIKNTINGKGTVREALKADYSPLEEGKADILGLYMVTALFEKGEIPDGELMDHYVTFLASIFRSVRFGATSAHGRANMLRFNYFEEAGAFSRDEATGRYSVNEEKMRQAMNSLSALIIRLQGEGDLDGVQELMVEKGEVGADLQKDLDRLEAAGIPVDVVFDQGLRTLGLD